MNLLEPHLPKAQYTAGNNIGITSSTCRHYTLINSIMCSDSYPIPILSLFFLYHPYIPSFLIQRIFNFLVMYYGSAWLLFICKLHCLQTFEHMSVLWGMVISNIWTVHCTLGHWTLHVCKISDLYLLRCLRYWDSN